MQPSCLLVHVWFPESNQQNALSIHHYSNFVLFPSAGNEPCPQPQTSEHLAAIEIMKLKHILILQNKIDLVKESQAKEQYEQILAFVQGEWRSPAPIR